MAVRKGLAGLAALLVGALAWADEGCSKPVAITSGEWAPYNFVDGHGRYTGMDVELSRAILQEAGCTLVELDRMPPSRNTFMFNTGKADLMAGASRTAERMRQAWFSIPYRTETVRLFATPAVLQRYPTLRTFADVVREKLTILAPRIGWYGEAYHVNVGSLKADNRLSQFNEFPDGINMMAAGRADLILGDQASVSHAAARRGLKLVPLPFTLVDAPVHMMFSRKTMVESDVRRIDAAIARLRKKGVLERIRQSYGGPYGSM